MKSRILIPTLVMLALAACDRKPAVPTGGTRNVAAVAVTMAPVRPQPTQRTIEVTGTLYGQEEATISAKAGGRIVDVFKDIGDRAGSGEPLAQIEKTDYELQKNKAEMAVRETLAKLGLTAMPAAGFDLTTVPTVRSARLQAENAVAKYNRGKQLHDAVPPLISDQDFADLKTAADVAASNLDVQVLGAGALLAEARTKEAEFKVAQQRQEDTTVRAPGLATATSREGLGLRVQGSAVPSSPNPEPRTLNPEPFAITARLVSDGEYVREGTPLFRLIQDDPLKLRSAVPERFGSEIKVGQRVAVRLEGVKEEIWGQVTRINPQVDLATRTFQIEAVIANPQRTLKAGAFARASVQTRMDPKAILVPETAISRFAGVTKVFTIKDGKAQEIRVDTGVTQRGMIEITRGLKGGEEIVITAAGPLATGVPLTMGPATAPATAPATTTAR